MPHEGAPDRSSPRGRAPSRRGGKAFVEALVSKGILAPLAVTKTKPVIGEGGEETTPALHTISMRGTIEPSAVVRAACAEERIVDYVDIEGYAVSPALLERLGRARAEALGVLPTVLLGQGRGPALCVSGGELFDDDRNLVARALRVDVVFLDADPARLRVSIRRAFEELDRRGASMIPIGEILVREGLVDAATVERALREAKARGMRLGEALLSIGAVDEEALYKLLAAQRNLPFVEASDIARTLDQELAFRLPSRYLRHTRVIPEAREGDVVRAVTADPIVDTSHLKLLLGAEGIALEIVTPTQLDGLFDHLDKLRDTRTPKPGPAAGPGA